MKKKILAIFVCSVVVIFSACNSNQTQDKTSISINAQPTMPNPSASTEATSKPAAMQDYTKLSKEEKTSLLISNIWRIVGEGSVRNGYFLHSEEELTNKGYYYRFYDNNTMHEWADDTNWNRLYKWKWNDDGTIQVTNYADETGASASKWYFDDKHLLNENLNTKDLTPMSITTTYPAEPEIKK